jgi:hypothetical protein
LSGGAEQDLVRGLLVVEGDGFGQGENHFISLQILGFFAQPNQRLTRIDKRNLKIAC